jgi:hypothetical protein
MAQLASIVKTMPGVELPAGSLIAVGGVPADRFVAFVPEGETGRLLTHDDLAAMVAAVKLRLDAALHEEPFATLSPRLVVKIGHAFLSEDPFYRFERRVHAAVHEARSLSDLRERNRDRVWGAELKKAMREEAIRTVWQPVVELSSGAFYGFEALARGRRQHVRDTARDVRAVGRVGLGDL